MAKRRKLVARACWSLFWTTAIAVASQVAIVLFEQYTKPELRDPEYDHRAAVLRQTLSENPGRPLVLVLGSSRVALGLQPQAIEKLQMPTGERPLVFNFSIPGSGSLRELIWLKRLLHDGTHPDGVVLECWPPLITGAFGEQETLFLSGHSLRLDDLWLLHSYAYRPLDLFEEWLSARAFPCYGDRPLLLARFAPTWLPPGYSAPDHAVMRQIDRFGALPAPDKPATGDYQSRLLASDRQRYEDKIAHWRLSQTSERAICETLRLCRSRDVPAMVVLMPESPEMLGWYTNESRAELEAFLKRFRRANPAALADARHWIAANGFFDSHHMVRDGAEEFTRRFGREVLPGLFTGPQPSTGSLLASGANVGRGISGNN